MSHKIRIGGELVGRAFIQNHELELEPREYERVREWVKNEQYRSLDEWLTQRLVGDLVVDYMNLADFEFDGDAIDLCEDEESDDAA